jgi:tetratricopeptide (TPR) repeat protein
MGDVDGALGALDQTVRLDDRMADAYYLRGVCLRDKQRTADAVKALEQALALSPALILPREELADIYGELGRRTDQIEQLQVLAGLDRQRVARHVAVGLAHARARHWDSAVLTLRAALERAQDDTLLYRALGQVWLESALAGTDRVDLSKARQALDRIASNPGATCEVLMLSGRAALQDGDLERAEHLLQQSTQRFPVDPTALVLYATVAERQNHADAARRALIQHAALVAGDTELVAHATKIALLSLRVNDPETAAQWIARGLEQDPQNAQLLALQKRATRPS